MSNLVLVTDRPDFLPLITQIKGAQTLLLEHPPVDLDKAGLGYDKSLVPEVRIENPKVVGQLSKFQHSKIVCITSPATESFQLPYGVKLASRSDNVFHVPLWVVTLPELEKALENPQNMSAFPLAEYLGRRLTERMLGRRVADGLKRGGKPYPGFDSFLLLQVISSLKQGTWNVDLSFGDFRMREVDAFFAVKFYARRPEGTTGKALMRTITRPCYYPNLQGAYHEIILQAIMSQMEIKQVKDVLQTLYAAGAITFPGRLVPGVHPLNCKRFRLPPVPFAEYGLQALREDASPLGRLISERTAVLQRARPCEESIRYYMQNNGKEDHCFRGVAYLAPEDPTFQPVNPVPDRAEFVQKLQPNFPECTFRNFLQRLTDLNLPLNLNALLKLDYSEYISIKGDLINVTPRGDEVLDTLRRNDAAFATLYVIHKLWERVGKGIDYGYNEVIERVCQTLEGKKTDKT